MANTTISTPAVKCDLCNRVHPVTDMEKPPRERPIIEMSFEDLKPDPDGFADFPADARHVCRVCVEALAEAWTHMKPEGSA